MNVKNTTKYNFSFTGASALIAETLVIAEEYSKLKDWKSVEQSLSDNNSLKKVKNSTFRREFSEIKKRLSFLTDGQLNVLVHGSYDDSKAIILLALVKTYTYLYDFVVEVIRHKYLLFDTVIEESDYIRFYNSKSITHDELTTITELTANKVRQVVFKVLVQVGLLSHIQNGSIIKPYLSEHVLDVIIEDNPALLIAFLYSNDEIKSYIQKLQHA